MPRENKKHKISGLFIPAGLFLGMGFGFLIDKLVAGMFLGLGLGFVGMIIYILTKKK
jgi:hypothetical protein